MFKKRIKRVKNKIVEMLYQLKNGIKNQIIIIKKFVVNLKDRIKNAIIHLIIVFTKIQNFYGINLSNN